MTEQRYENGWKEWGQMVLAELKRLAAAIKELDNKLEALRERVAKNEARLERSDEVTVTTIPPGAEPAKVPDSKTTALFVAGGYVVLRLLEAGFTLILEIARSATVGG